MADYINFGIQGELTPDAVSRDIQHLMFKRSFYGKLMKQVYRGANDILSSDRAHTEVDAAIAMFIDLFQKNHTDVVRIPTVDRFRGGPVIGDPTLVGSAGAALKWLQTVCYVVPMGKAFTVDTAPGNKLRTPDGIDLLVESREAIARWMGDQITDWITRTWFEGLPPAIHLDPVDVASGVDPELALFYATSETLNKGRRHHPNMWFANQAEPTRSMTHTTDDANINTTLTALDADASSAAKFGSAALDRFAEYLEYKDVQKSSVIDGSECWDIFVDGAQRREAGDDDKILKATQSAFSGLGHKDPSLMGQSLIYNGFRIIKAPSVAAEVHFACLRASTGAGADGYRVQYGPMETNERYHYNMIFGKRSDTLATRNLKGAVVLTPGAMLSGMVGGVGDSFRVREAEDGRSTNIYATQFVGMARNDKRRGTSWASPTEIINQTSAVLVTNSPEL
jgi:hypothetical protein